MKGFGSTADISDEIAETLEFSNLKEHDLTRVSFMSGSTKPVLSCLRRKESIIAVRFVKMFGCREGSCKDSRTQEALPGGKA